MREHCLQQVLGLIAVASRTHERLGTQQVHLRETHLVLAFLHSAGCEIVFRHVLANERVVNRIFRCAVGIKHFGEECFPPRVAGDKAEDGIELSRRFILGIAPVIIGFIHVCLPVLRLYAEHHFRTVETFLIEDVEHVFLQLIRSVVDDVARQFGRIGIVRPLPAHHEHARLQALGHPRVGIVVRIFLHHVVDGEVQVIHDALVRLGHRATVFGNGTGQYGLGTKQHAIGTGVIPMIGKPAQEIVMDKGTHEAGFGDDFRLAVAGEPVVGSGIHLMKHTVGSSQLGVESLP